MCLRYKTNTSLAVCISYFENQFPKDLSYLESLTKYNNFVIPILEKWFTQGMKSSHSGNVQGFEVNFFVGLGIFRDICCKMCNCSKFSRS